MKVEILTAYFCGKTKKVNGEVRITKNTNEHSLQNFTCTADVKIFFNVVKFDDVVKFVDIKDVKTFNNNKELANEIKALLSEIELTAK